MSRFRAFDPERRSLLMGFIERAAQTLDVPILYITHSEEEMGGSPDAHFFLIWPFAVKWISRTAASHN